jgi:hypothetical protein
MDYVKHFRACANSVNIRPLTSEMQIDVEADGDMEDDGAWLAQAIPFLNSTLFAVTYLSRVPSMTGIWI